MKPQGDIRIFCRVGSGLLNGNLIEGELIGTFASYILKVGGFFPRYFNARLSISCRVAVESST